MKCYRCQKKLSPKDTRCRSCGQDVYTTYSGSGVAMGRRIDGAIVGEPSAKDYIASPTLSSIPRQVDLRDHCTAVEDQGQLGSCVSCAVVGAIEYQHRKAGKPSVDLSRMFVYYNARRIGARETIDSGTTTSEAMAAILAYGAPPESVWPYDVSKFDQQPNNEAFARAREHAPSEYARVVGSEHVKGALAQQFPVVILLTLPSRCYEEAAKTGVIPTPTQAEVDFARIRTGHSVLLVGYDLDKGRFLARNSWGEDWGTRGYCELPFDAFDMAAHPTSNWILGKLETGNAFTVVRPKLERKPVEGSVRDKAASIRDDLRSSLSSEMDDALKAIRDRMGR